MKLHGELAHIL